MTLAFRKGKAFICQNPACSKKFYKHGYASNSSYRHVSAGSEEALNEKLERIEADGQFRREGTPQHYQYSDYWWQGMRSVNHVEYGPFFHSQGCMYEWIGDNIPDIYNILLAQNNNSVNLPE